MLERQAVAQMALYICVNSLCIQASDSSHADEITKTSATGAAEQEKPTTSTSADGQKTDDENTVIAIFICAVH